MMKQKEFIKEVIKLFAENTGCAIQYSDCPCNTCFHSIDADFRQICWSIIVGLRGDYKEDYEMLIEGIKEKY